MSAAAVAAVFGAGMLITGLIVAVVVQGFIGFVALVAGVGLMVIGFSAAMSTTHAAPARGRV